jgi:hypothetical protein
VNISDNVDLDQLKIGRQEALERVEHAEEDQSGRSRR